MHAFYLTDYSERAFVVGGDTKPWKEELRAMHGKWNYNIGAWVFSNRRRGEVEEWIAGNDEILVLPNQRAYKEWREMRDLSSAADDFLTEAARLRKELNEANSSRFNLSCALAVTWSLGLIGAAVAYAHFYHGEAFYD